MIIDVRLCSFSTLIGVVSLHLEIGSFFESWLLCQAPQAIRLQSAHRLKIADIQVIQKSDQLLALDFAGPHQNRTLPVNVKTRGGCETLTFCTTPVATLRTGSSACRSNTLPTVACSVSFRFPPSLQW